MKKIIMYIVPLIICVQIYGQSSGVIEDDSDQVNKIDLQIMESDTFPIKLEEGRTILTWDLLTNDILNKLVREKCKSVYSIDDDERVIFYNNKCIYTLEELRDKYEMKISKYESLSNGKKVNELVLPYEAAFYVINKNEDMLFIEFGDGETFSYIFYDSDFNEIYRYIPYKYGSFHSEYATNNNNIIIVSQETDSSKICRVSLIKNFSSELNSELITDSYSIRDVKLFRNCFVLFLFESSSKNAIITAYNFEFEKIWSKEIDSKVISGRLISNYYNNLILLPYIDRINFISMKDGKTDTTFYFEKELNNLVPVKIFNTKHPNYLYFSYSEILNSQQELTFDNNQIGIISYDNYELVFNKKLESSKSRPQVFLHEKGIIVYINDKYMNFIVKK